MMAFDPVTCAICQAICTEAKHLNRFNRRHPAKCQERREFSRQLAEGTRSVEADEKPWIGDEGAKPKDYRPDYDPKNPLGRLLSK